MNYFVRALDMVLAVILMFLNPAIYVHVQIREELFENSVKEIEAYLDTVCRQGYILKDYLTEWEDGKFVWKQETECDVQMACADNEWVYQQLSDMESVYMNQKIIPFETGSLLKVTVSFPYDAMEQLYFGCREEGMHKRTRIYLYVVRDGIITRAGCVNNP